MTQPLPPNIPPEPVVDETLTPLEAAFYALVLAELTAWLAAAARAVLAPWRLLKLPIAPMELWSLVPMWQESVARMTAWLRGNAAPHGWDRWNSEHPDLPQPRWRSTDQYVRDHLEQVANYLVRIPDEVFELVRVQLVQGQEAGEGFEEIAQRVDRVLRVTGSENWPNRARVIAVTETNGAANAGWLAAGFQTQTLLGRELFKEWLASNDSNVRPEHKAADGQRRRLREPFIVGGVPMMMPGDKSAPVHLVANCRCAGTTTEER